MVSLSVRTLDTYIAEGRIPVRRIRGRVLIAHAALERFASQDQE